MNSKTTGIWFVIAAALFAFIFVFEHFLRPAAAESAAILPDLRPAAVTSVQVIPAGALEIRADRTNGGWLLTKPVAYPAQAAAIEALLDALQKLTPATRISAAELREHKNSDAEFGFENPQSTLVIEAGDQRWQLAGGQQNRARRPGLSARRRRGRRVRGRRRLAQIHSAFRQRMARHRAGGRRTKRRRLDCADQRHESHRAAARRDQPSLAHDPAVAGARRHRPHHRRAATSATARVTQFVTDDPKADLDRVRPAARRTRFVARARHQFRRRRSRRQKSDQRCDAGFCAARRLEHHRHDRQGAAGAVARRGE